MQSTQDSQGHSDNVESFFENAEDFSKDDSIVEIEPFEESNLHSLLQDSPDVLASTVKANQEFEEANSDILDAENNQNNNEFVDDFAFDALKNNPVNSNDPFYETFDSGNIVNRAKTANFITIDEEEAEKNEADANEKTESFYIPKSELAHLLNDNPGIKFFKKDDSGNIKKLSEDENINIEDINSFAEDSEEFNEDEFIKIAIPIREKTDSNQDESSTPEPTKKDLEYRDYDSDSDEDDDDSYYLSEEELEERRQKEELRSRLKGIQDVIDAINAKGSYKKPDEIFSEFLQENFQDYLLAKKISGNNQIRFSDKVINKEVIEDSNKQIEVNDLIQTSGTEIKKTSVLVNRNDEMEIEDIEIFCKCGEKTVIKFDATDDLESKSDIINTAINTHVVIDAIRTNSLISDNANNNIIDNNSSVSNTEKIIPEHNSATDTFKEDDY